MKLKNLVGLGISTWVVKKVANKIAEEVSQNEHVKIRLEREEEERIRKYEKERLESERKQKARENRETFRESLRPNLFVNYINEEQFETIVKKVTKRIKRIEEVTIENGKVKCVVVSNSGISSWRFKLDFNDFGVLSGCFWIVYRGNYDSNIASTVGKRIRDEIQRINNENKDYVYLDSDELYPLESFLPKMEEKKNLKKDAKEAAKNSENKTNKNVKKKSKEKDNSLIILLIIAFLMILALGLIASIL